MPRTKLRTFSKEAFNFHELSLAEQVKRAMPLVRDVILEGIDDRGGLEDRTIHDLAERLAGERVPEDMSDEDNARVWNGLSAAHAIGIALGMMLRPDVFLKPGVAR